MIPGGTVYLLHFDRSMPRDRGVIVSPVQHYLGFTDQLGRRLAHHRRGTGARITAAAVARGIAFTLARTWRGDRHLERRLKNRHEHNKLCPECKPMTAHAPALGMTCQGCEQNVCRACLRHLTRRVSTRGRPFVMHSRRVGCK